jgi:hypothetical protein
METNFGFGKPVDLDFEEAIATVTEELGKEGFGVLTEIDVSATMKKKLDEDMPPYRILGVFRKSACCFRAMCWCDRKTTGRYASASWIPKVCSASSTTRGSNRLRRRSRKSCSECSRRYECAGCHRLP